MNDNNILNGDVQTLRDILAKFEEHEKAIGEIELLGSKQRSLLRNIEVRDKKNKAQIDAAIKKKREEDISSFDKDIARESDNLKKAKNERDKALAKGKEQRIKDETESLRKDNERLHAELKGITRANKLLPICRSKFFLAMFATKGAVEQVIFMVTFIVSTCILPYLVFWLLPIDKPIVLAAIYCAFWILLALPYLYINNRIKVNKWEIFKNIRLYKLKIEQNRKHIQKISGAINRDTDEGSYNLNDFDSKIDEAEKTLNELIAKKEAAVNEFENVTKLMIIEEKEAPMREERAMLVSELESTEKALSEWEQKEKTSAEALAKYESSLGKELINRDVLNKLIKNIESGNAQNVSQAINCYKDAENK